MRRPDGEGARVNHWAFIAAAYAIAIGGTIATCALSYAAMRRAERRAEELTRR